MTSLFELFFKAYSTNITKPGNRIQVNKLFSANCCLEANKAHIKLIYNMLDIYFFPIWLPSLKGQS